MADEQKIKTIFDAPGDDEQDPEGDDGCYMGSKYEEVEE